MKKIIEGNSTPVTMKFYAPYNKAKIPVTAEYCVFDVDSNTMIVSHVSFSPTDFKYVLDIDPEVNKIIDPTKTEEYRKVVVKWTDDKNYVGVSPFIYKIVKI